MIVPTATAMLAVTSEPPANEGIRTTSSLAHPTTMSIIVFVFWELTVPPCFLVL
jgi:hypothetical protein